MARKCKYVLSEFTKCGFYHFIILTQAEKASLVHLLDFLGMIFLTMIWAVCPRDSLALLGQWVQSKLQEVSLRWPMVDMQQYRCKAVWIRTMLMSVLESDVEFQCLFVIFRCSSNIVFN